MPSSRQRRKRLPRVGRGVVGFVLVKGSFRAFAPNDVDDAALGDPSIKKMQDGKYQRVADATLGNKHLVRGRH